MTCRTLSRTRPSHIVCNISTASEYGIARIEPRLGIILVRIRREPGKGHEVRRCPFPHIANHLPATEGAVTRGAPDDLLTLAEILFISFHPAGIARLCSPPGHRLPPSPHRSPRL